MAVVSSSNNSKQSSSLMSDTSFQPKQIHNVALIGPSGVGKTLLVDALLVECGSINHIGSIEDGTTVSDFEPEEHSRKSSLQLSIASAYYNSHKINLLDTPGAIDFAANVDVALGIADIAVLVLSAVDQLGVQAELALRSIQQSGIPYIIFINKLDGEHANIQRVQNELAQLTRRELAVVEIAFDDNNGHLILTDLIDEVSFKEDQGKIISTTIPDDIANLERQKHNELIEEIVTADDALMSLYLEGETPTPTQLEKTLTDAASKGEMPTVLCGSAKSGLGIQRLARLLSEIHHERPIVGHGGDSKVVISRDDTALPLARVFKISYDLFAGKISYLQILSGTIKPDITLINTRTHEEERLHVLEGRIGKNTIHLNQAIAGDIVTTQKLINSRVGDTLAPKNQPIALDNFPIRKPSYMVKLKARTAGDEEKLSIGLHRLAEEDPGIAIISDALTHQTNVAFGGEEHLQVTVARLAHKYHVEVDIEDIAIAYRATIMKPSQAEGRYKKQSGGHGQFGIAHIRIEPLERGGGIEFVDEVVGGAIPKQYIPAIEKGVRKALEQGGQLGFPVVDIRIICDDGKFHPVDSSEASFEMAGFLAMNEALTNAGLQILEPISRLEIHIPSRFQGNILSDIATRRGRILMSEPDTVDKDSHIVVALVPKAELTRYGITLRSLSNGYGSFTETYDHFEVTSTLNV
ncbi:MAG: elongation factor G [Firmicutes bacterium]|nr:elongation factor G [Bacillota bacterium]